MRLVNFLLAGGVRAGVVYAGKVYDVTGIRDLKDVRCVDDILSAGLIDRLQNSIGELSSGIQLESTKLLQPVMCPDKILLAAVNYKTHGREQSAQPPKEPYFFTKFKSCMIAHGEPIIIPKASKKVDWEAELAVVIGRKGKYISRESAMEYIAGYTVVNDVSFRDLQFPEGWPEKPNPLGQNWVKGKALDSALPIGPWLVTKDEVPNPYNLSITLNVNGVRRQSGRTDDMIFGIDRLVEYLSYGMTLFPGDVISTGTPAGVAAFSRAPFLKHGDVVDIEIEKVGKLSNPVVEEGHEPRIL